MALTIPSPNTTLPGIEPHEGFAGPPFNHPIPKMRSTRHAVA